MNLNIEDMQRKYSESGEGASSYNDEAGIIDNEWILTNFSPKAKNANYYLIYINPREVFFVEIKGEKQHTFHFSEKGLMLGENEVSDKQQAYFNKSIQKIAKHIFFNKIVVFSLKKAKETAPKLPEVFQTFFTKHLSVAISLEYLLNFYLDNNEKTRKNIAKAIKKLPKILVQELTQEQKDKLDNGYKKCMITLRSEIHKIIEEHEGPIEISNNQNGIKYKLKLTPKYINYKEYQEKDPVSFEVNYVSQSQDDDKKNKTLDNLDMIIDKIELCLNDIDNKSAKIETI
jgi:hypothetical protein